MSNKAKTIEFIVKQLEKLAPKNDGIKMVADHLNSLSEKDFKAYMEKARDGEWAVPLYAPNLSENEVFKGQALKVAEELGLDLFHHLKLTDPQTGEEFTTPLKYLVLPMPVRRQEQHLIKKKSLPPDDRVVDHLSGQATGDSKGSSISMPELLVLNSKGFENSLVEMIKVRGGDAAAFRHMNKSMVEQGSYSLKPIEEAGTNTKANETFAAILFAMHLDNDLLA